MFQKCHESSEVKAGIVAVVLQVCSLLEKKARKTEIPTVPSDKIQPTHGK